VVNKGEVNSWQDFVSIWVVSENNPPVADAGEDQSVPEGVLVMFDGSSSYDTDEDPISYSWISLQGVSMIQADDTDPILIAPYVDNDSVFQFTLTVFDGELLSEPDTLNLYVTNTDAIPSANLQSGMELYPNPAIGTIVISSEFRIGKIELLNLQGIVVKQLNSDALSIEMDLNDVPSGNYILRIYTGSGIIDRQLILK
jgi:hypothetical protein